MSLTFSSQAKPALSAIGAPLLALAPGAAAVAAWIALRRWLRRAPRARRVMVWLALVAGGLLALAALAVGPLPTHSGVEHLFVPRGWWDVGPAALLTERIPEALGAALALVATPLGAMPEALRGLLVTFLVALTLTLAAALAERRPARVLAAMACGVLLVLLAAALGVYAAYVLLWLAAYLNFWVFALMLVALQRWRHGAI
jgi:hypothetical protein